MRKTKRRILRTKRRILRSKRRTTQRKFKYQRGGETEEELKSDVEAAIQNVKTKEAEYIAEESRFRQLNTTHGDAYNKVSKLQDSVNNIQKPGILINNSPATIQKKKNELAQADAELKKLNEQRNASTKISDKLLSAIHEHKKTAVPLLETFIARFPSNSKVPEYNTLIDQYREVISIRENRMSMPVPWERAIVSHGFRLKI
jgi:chromosome segregation ATPase